MKTLGTTVKISGVGSTASEATLISRIGRIAMYSRGESIFEVFKVQTKKAGDVFGKQYPDREIYPSNEDFGKTAWCYSSFERASSKFSELEELELATARFKFEELVTEE